MFKATKYLLVYFILLFIPTTSCDDSSDKLEIQKTECEQIKDIMTDCLGLHRGALGYVDSCGSVSLEKVEKLNSCSAKLDYIKNRNQ